MKELAEVNSIKWIEQWKGANASMKEVENWCETKSKYEGRNRNSEYVLTSKEFHLFCK